MSNDSFAIQVRAIMRSAHSTVEPQLIVKGHHPIIVITPDIEDKNPDVMTVDIDATGFEVVDLAAILSALAATLLDGAGKEIKTSTPPSKRDWEKAVADLTGEDLGENEPDGASK